MTFCVQNFVILDYPKKTIIEDEDELNGLRESGFKGSPTYATPKIWKENDYQKAGDVYAFSLIVFEIITNEKPSKVLLDEYLCPKLSDFGSCTKHHDGHSISFQSTCGIKSKNSYLAPKYFFFINVVQLADEMVQNDVRPKFIDSINQAYKNLIELCWSENPNDRPTFDSIVDELKNDSSFIVEGIDKDDFHKYIKYIDEYHKSFEISNQIIDIDDFVGKNSKTFVKVSLKNDDIKSKKASNKSLNENEKRKHHHKKHHGHGNK